MRALVCSNRTAATPLAVKTVEAQRVFLAGVAPALGDDRESFVGVDDVNDEPSLAEQTASFRLGVFSRHQR